MTVQQVEVVVRRAGQPERRVMLSAGVTQVGRAEDNDLVLPDIGVSRRHARIVFDSGTVRVDDLGSGNGTTFRGRRFDSQVMADGDEVVIDPFVIAFRFVGAVAELPEDDDTVRAPPDAGFSGAAARVVVLQGNRLASSYPVGGAPLSLGRSEARDIVLFDPAASRDHARVELRADGYWLVDRGSANGTYCDEQRVVDALRLQHGAHLRIGATEFRFELAEPSSASQAPHVPAALPPPPPAPAPAPPPPAYVAPAPPPPAYVPPAPAPAPPATVSPVPAQPVFQPAYDSPAAAAPAPPPPRRSNAPLIAAIVIGFFLVVLGVGAGAIGLVLMNDGDLASRLGIVEELPELPPAYQVQARNVDEVARLMADGAMHFDQRRYMDAAGRYYKVVKGLEPQHPGANREGFITCEYVAFGILADSLRAGEVDPKEHRSLKRTVLAQVAEAEKSGTGLVEARLAVEDALLVVGKDAELSNAEGRVRRALASRLKTSELVDKQETMRTKVLLGEVSMDGGDLDKARSALEAAIALDPEGLIPDRYRAEHLLRMVEYRAGHP